MYSQTNNRLITKYTEFLQQNQDQHQNQSDFDIVIPPEAEKLKKVRYPSVLPTRSPPHNQDPSWYQKQRFKYPRRLGNLPGVLLRQNMDQWVAKIVRFYINGDEHLPRYEYRFKPGRDVHNFDGLCDILSQRLKLPSGVRYIFTLEGHPIWSLDELRHERAYVVSSIKKFKALNYGGEVFNGGREEHGRKRLGRNRPPSAPSQRNPPIIRVRRERSLNGVVWGSPHQESSGGSSEQNNIDGIQGRLQRTAIEAEKVLKAAIEESQTQRIAELVHKQIIRIINGSDPTIQSQVLLNTRVSQEWMELVKDLGLAVKIPRTVESRMETLTGRPIQSYSQLRSQLKAGNEAFYIYNTNSNRSNSTLPPSRGGPAYSNYQTHGGLSPYIPMGKSLSNPTLPFVESSLGSKFPNSIIHNQEKGNEKSSNKLQLPQSQSQSQNQNFISTNIKAISSSSLYKTQPQHNNQSTSSNTYQLTNQNKTQLTNSSSHPNLGTIQRRKSNRQRYEDSKYLAQFRRAPSPSP